MSETTGTGPVLPDALPSVRSALPWTATATLVMAAASFLQFTAAARILGPAGAGQYALGLAILAPLTMLLGLGLRDLVQARRCNWDQYRQLLGLRLVASAALVILAAALQPFVSLPGGFLAMMAVWRASELVQELIAGMFLRLGRAAASAAPITAGQTLSTIGFAGALIAGTDLVLATAIGAGASLLVAACSAVGIARSRPPGLPMTPTWADLGGWVRMGTPPGCGGRHHRADSTRPADDPRTGPGGRGGG